MNRSLAFEVALCCALVAPGAPAAAPAKPNIVMVMTDDLDTDVWNTALALGYLPRIKADLIDRGTTFANMFVTESLCCPSRVTYYTGQYPHNHGVIRVDGPNGGFQHFTHDESTIAVWLRQAGYRTGLMGKYLNGYGEPAAAYIPPGWDTWYGLFGPGQFNYAMSAQGRIVEHGQADGDYQTDVLASLAVDFLRNADRRPFFLTVTPTAPHFETHGHVRPAPRYADTPDLPRIPPEDAPSFDEQDMADKPRWMHDLAPVDAAFERTAYNEKVAAVRAVDDLVGRIIDTLRETERLDDTLLIFTSDNGYQYGTHRCDGKLDLYEESIRVPMVVAGFGTQHRVVSDIVLNTDWAATIVDLAGAQPDIVMDGRSLVPLLHGGSIDRRTLLVELPVDPGRFGTHAPFAAVRTQDPAYTGDPSGQDVLVYAETYDADGRLTDRELYDLGIDPAELDSLHRSTHPLRRRQMSALAQRLQLLKTCKGDECPALER